MKKLIGILTLVLVFSLTANAQKQGQKRGMKADYTPEQIATLKAKKMALHLDLSDSQQKQVYDLMKDNAIERKANMEEMKKMRESGEKPGSNQRFALETKRIDKQIAHKKAMKNILDKDQFEKWEKFQAMKMRKGQKSAQKGMKGKKGQRGERQQRD